MRLGARGLHKGGAGQVGHSLQAVAAAAAAVLCIAIDGDRALAAATPALDIAADQIMADPNTTFGTLPNGLRYAIKSNATPKGSLSLRLVFDVGSYDEGPDEHGAAHFVEHLAFSGGDNAHSAGPENDFADIGVELGRDQNALTYDFSTVYKIDLPRTDAVATAIGFRWLRKVADGAIFSEDAVDRERQIILAERAVGQGPQQLLGDDLERFLLPHLRAARPETIGTPAELAGLTAARLQAFYRRLYRPDDAIIVAVGDVSEQALRQQIESTFGTWTANGPKPAPPSPGTVAAERAEEVMTRSEPRLPTTIYVCKVGPNEPYKVDTVAAVRQRLLTSLWVEIADRRLGAIAGGPSPPFVSAQVFSSTDLRAARNTCLLIIPQLGQWQQALRAAWLEIRRMSEGGISQEEIDAAIENQRANFRGAMHVAQTSASAGIATEIAGRALNHEVYASPPEAFRVFDVAAESVRIADVEHAFATDWTGGGPLIALSTDSKVAESAVQQVWQDAQRAMLTTAAPNKPAAWSYGDFGKAGQVVSRTNMTNPDFVRMVFSNGLVLNFKHTDFAHDQVKVRVRFGGGRREIAPDDLVQARLGAALLAQMGLGRNDYVDLQQQFSQIDWNAELRIEDRGFVLSGSTTGGDFKSQLEILAAFASDPGFRDSFDSQIPTLADAFYRDARSDPASVLRYGLEHALQSDAREGLPARQDLLRLRARDFAAELKPAITSDPLEVTVVGDVSEEVATEYVAETFGALPPRPAKPAPRYDSGFLRFPTSQSPTIRLTHEGPTDVAIIAAIWPLYVATPERRREEVSLSLLSKVFDNALRHRIRHELGRTYSPDVGMATPDLADQGYMQAVVQTAPADAALVMREIEAMAEKLSHGQFSDEDLEAARAPIVAAMKARHSTNDWWVAGLDGSAQEPGRLKEMTDLLPLFETVTASEVRKAAATWLAARPIELVALPSTAAALTDRN